MAALLRAGSWLPLCALALAVAVPWAMNFGGLSDYDALALAPLLFLFWAIQRLPRREVGIRLAPPRHFGFALLYPLIVLGSLAAIAAATHAIDLSHAVLWKAAVNIGIIFVSNSLIAIVTEEGFFRGWAWASLRRAGMGPRWVLLSTSVAFSLWHLPGLLVDEGYGLMAPKQHIPWVLLNAVLIGAVWGVLRERSGSVVVASVSHGAYNAFDYVLFGFGANTGALGIADSALYHPDVGVLGLAANATYLIVILLLWKPQSDPCADVAGAPAAGGSRG